MGIKRWHAVVAAVFAAASLIPLGAAPAWADAAGDALSLINEARSEAGLSELTLHLDLVEAAEEQAAAIAAAGYLFHNPDLASVTTGWRSVGENVGYGPSVSVVHAAFMDSDGHRANILDPDYDYVGVGVVVSGGHTWVAQVFMEAASYTPPFADDDGSVHEESIIALYEAGITSGCGPTLFCPDQPVTRGQMAAFLSRALHLPAGADDLFTDDDSSPFEQDIEALAQAGITKGCGPAAYCPDSPVTRAEMATFLDRALGP